MPTGNMAYSARGRDLATTTGSALRSRKVDARRPLSIYHFHEAPDLDESSALNRTIPQVATGVEKEEEEEHHLQAALVANHTNTQVVIPTPDASTLIPFNIFESLYIPNFQLPKSLIRFSTVVEDVIGCMYNLDEIDDDWISTYNRKHENKADHVLEDDFEAAIVALDNVGNDKVSGECPTFEETQSHFSQSIYPQNFNLSPDALANIYVHWKYRRYTEKLSSLIPKFKTEEISSKPDSDPYVCFRRREIKPIRKARRADIQGLDKLRKLREDLKNAKLILDLVTQREETRRDSIYMEHLIFERRILVRRLKRRLGVVDTEATPDSRRKKSRRLTDFDETGESTKIRIPMQKLRDAANLVSDLDSKLFADQFGPSTISVEDKVKKIRNLDERNGWADVTEDPFLGIGTDELNLWRTVPLSDQVPDIHFLQANTPRVACIRRRIGRGGRIVFDRRHCQSDRRLHEAHATKWRFDDSDDEMDEEIEYEDDHMLISNRAFAIAPLEEEYRLLMNKPAFPDQIHVQPLPDILKLPTTNPPIQVIRAPTGAAAHSSALATESTSTATTQPSIASLANVPTPVKKRLSKSNSFVTDSKGTSQPSLVQPKKKIQEQLDPRTAAVKAMMLQSQRQAQQQINLSQSIQQPALANSSSFSPTNGAVNSAQSTDSLYLSTSSASTASALASSTVASSAMPISLNGMTPAQIQQLKGQHALYQMRLQQQRLRLQQSQQLAPQSLQAQIQMQFLNPSQTLLNSQLQDQLQASTTDQQATMNLVGSLAQNSIPSLASNTSLNLAQQQLQQLYFNNQALQQQQHAAMSQNNSRFIPNNNAALITSMMNQSQLQQAQQAQLQQQALLSSVNGHADSSSSGTATGIQQLLLNQKFKAGAIPPSGNALGGSNTDLMAGLVNGVSIPSTSGIAQGTAALATALDTIIQDANESTHSK
ncbi:hypothetical protein BATDEDRAFT_34799 [Batrachochytrium dendrobatidis JAM81]|uniref:Enhancer of polycomb-like protein n=2 Tax=Batrachochytrium dendrobatidis TaxID=109871 RepID=F4NZK8_BATDJ|nr:uncharacterized protein BATDEDRAFT_34799 [Batrachochytrium dendrobatidis JAM81]EGF81202.1 hypothetical protein BATDEDRAFT_34799 [Batrachochytrium dendrobatidis JAM81]OAJ38312.1 hypothetical protein BDEG_22259 [Batrachochytrium dendrobatidis JEL423]|eukprot:XP_006678007.1 hypothetical protein BATDEDRAFT_34799 [Batrachochytrium dendrobatidis JAM81]